MRFQLLDTANSELVVEADTLEAVAEVRAVLRETGADVDSLVILRWDSEDDEHPSLVE